MTYDQIIIEDLELMAAIGVFDHERIVRQPIIINLVLSLAPLGVKDDHQLSNVVRYDLICEQITILVNTGHIDLVETLAEDIADICLAYDRCEQVDVRVMKTQAIQNASGVGVRLMRAKQ
ncbi:MAG: dihydroneopterin aldolase [Robiginitomaculum sp.]|nr:MAG: dihydroneopterin aldolase [Robiginitomaculum sp.]